MKFKLYLLFICIISFSFSSCKRDPPLYEVDNLNGNVISAFGHGGMGVGFKYPIDTYESLEPCIRIGADGSEMDIQLTKDSVLVVHHNSNLNESTLCSGTINDKLWSEIWGCHYASPFSSTINLRSVNDLLLSIPELRQKTITFDCKLYSNASDHTAYLDQYANAIIRLMSDYDIPAERLFIESQDTAFLNVLKTKQADLRLFIYPANFEEGFARAKTMNLFGITISNDKIGRASCRERV